jgi:hypothetical protein
MARDSTSLTCQAAAHDISPSGALLWTVPVVIAMQQLILALPGDDVSSDPGAIFRLVLVALTSTRSHARPPQSEQGTSASGIGRRSSANVKHWQDGDMRKRWTAAGMLVAEQQFRRIIGYRDLATLVIAVERHALRAAPNTPRPQGPLPSDRQPRRSPPKFHDDPDILAF